MNKGTISDALIGNFTIDLEDRILGMRFFSSSKSSFLNEIS